MDTALPMNTVKDETTRLKRYTSYPATHFSRWRAYFQALVLFFLIMPVLKVLCRPKVYGCKNRLKKGPFIVASNHISTYDPPLVAYALRYPVAFMAKKELFDHWFMAEFYRSQGTFALNRDNPDSATLKTALAVLRSSGRWALGIFPEGTRSTTGEILPLKKGIGSMAQKTQLPVLPVGLYKDAKGCFILTIGEPITDVSDADRVQEQVYEALVHLTDPSWERQ